MATTKTRIHIVWPDQHKNKHRHGGNVGEIHYYATRESWVPRIYFFNTDYYDNDEQVRAAFFRMLLEGRDAYKK